MGRMRGMVRMLATGVACALTSVSQAQPRGGFGGGDLFTPPVSDRELDRIVELLGVSEEVGELAESLLEAMEADWEVQRDEMRQVMDDARDEFRDTRDFSVWEDLRPIMEKFGEKREQMEASFLGELKLLLTEEQVEQWPRVERMLLRQRSQRDGLLSGEAVDLVEVADQVELESSAREAIGPVLDRYEEEMHRALEHRNEVFEDGMSQGMSLFRNQDFETIEKLFAKATEAAERVRDTNRRYARQVLQVLPEESQTRFDQLFHERSFPRVYRQAWVTTALDAAEAFDDLTVEQRAQVKQLRESYVRDSRPLNDRWAKAIEESEGSRTFQSMFGGGEQSEDVRAAQDSRRDLDRRYSEQLKSVLTEEQAGRLPEEERRDFRERGRDRFQRGDRDQGDRRPERSDGV